MNAAIIAKLNAWKNLDNAQPGSQILERIREGIEEIMDEKYELLSNNILDFRNWSGSHFAVFLGFESLVSRRVWQDCWRRVFSVAGKVEINQFSANWGRNIAAEAGIFD